MIDNIVKILHYKHLQINFDKHKQNTQSISNIKAPMSHRWMKMNASGCYLSMKRVNRSDRSPHAVRTMLLRIVLTDR